MGCIAHLFKVIYFSLRKAAIYSAMGKWDMLAEQISSVIRVKINATHIMDATVHVQGSALCVITVVITPFATCKQALGFLFPWMPDQPTGS